MWSFSGDDFKISDPTDGTVYFRCAGKAFSLREKKTLLDNMGQPVLNMKEGLMTFTDKFTIYAGNTSDKVWARCLPRFFSLVSRERLSNQFCLICR